MSWEEFKTLFQKHHSPKAIINKIKEEFTQIRQNDEPIYKITFYEELVQTEELKIYHYHNMLHGDYRGFLNPSTFKSLAEIIDDARERDIELNKQVERGERKTFDQNPSPTKKLKFT